MSLDRFISLFHRRWAVPVLVEIERGRGAKFITLANRLGMGRETLRATLDHLIALGLVERNPGYGHPMRPEYLLTADGAQLAPTSGRLVATVRRLDLEPLAFKKWTMPLTLVIGGAERRFGELRSELQIITPLALTLSLKQMQASDLIERFVHNDYPPVTSYRLHPRAQPILRALKPLAAAV